MALKKNTNKETTENTAPAEEEVKAETTAVVKKEPASVSVKTSVETEAVFIMIPALQELAAAANYGDFPSIVASSGSHMMKTAAGKVSLGEVIEFQAIYAKTVWKVSPGDTSDAAKDFFKVSYDGEVCEDGTPIQDALADAEGAGYNAKIVEGVDVVIFIQKCEKDPAQVGELRTLQLSPSSRRNWTPLAANVGAKAELGMLKAVPIVASRDEKAVMFRSDAVISTGEHDYTYFDFELV